MASHETVQVYIAGCEGLKALACEFSLPLFKIGTTRGDLLQRLAQLDADQYAANYRHGRKMVTEPGFNRWRLTTLDFDLPKSLNSPIWIEPRALRVRLPRSLAPDDFERLVRDELHGFLWQPGSKRPTASGISRNSESIWHGLSATRLMLTGRSHASPVAEEIYIFRRADMPRLCKIIESIASAA